MKGRGKRVEAKLDAILAKLGVVEQEEGKIMALIDDLLADVQAESTVVGSVETLLTNLSQMLAAALAGGSTPAQVQAIKDVVDSNSARLTAAVVANTPAATP